MKLRLVIISFVLYATMNAQENLKTGLYTYSGPGTVNTHWIETSNDGLIVIDAQRGLTHAKEALEEIKKLGKPVRAILVTHGHPDHYVGLGVFKEAFPKAIILSSKTTYETIKNDPYGFNKLVQELMPNEAPEEFILPDKIFSDNETLSIDGLEIVTREMGKAEANSATVYYVPQTKGLYTGDLVLNHLHALFGEASTTEWLAALDRIDILFPNAKMIHPGHGMPGPKQSVLEEQRSYIVNFRRMVLDKYKRFGATEKGKKAAIDTIEIRFPYENPAGIRPIVPISVDGVFKEFEKEKLKPIKK